MGALDRLSQSLDAQQQARRAQSDSSGLVDYATGFANSALSGLTELVGQKPDAATSAFREANPIGGVVSQLLSSIVPYAGTEFAAAKLPRVAEALEGLTGAAAGRMGVTAAENPIAYGAVEGLTRYAPVELGRLGIGLATTPSHDWGDLFQDVGLSELLNGGFGAAAGYFRAGGKVLPTTGRVVGADLALKPTFELRMGLQDGAQAWGDVSLSDVQQSLVQKVLTEHPFDDKLPGTRGNYVDALDGGDSDGDKIVNSFFQTKGNDLSRKLLVESDGARTLNVGELQGVLDGAGFKSPTELAANSVYPRVMDVKSERAAGALGKQLDDARGLQQVSPGVMLGRESNDGLWVVGVKLRSGAAEAEAAGATKVSQEALGPASVAEPELPLAGGKTAPKTFGSAGVSEGDRWLWLKTDDPNRFVPDGAKVAKLNASLFSKYQEAFKPGPAADIFNQGDDAIIHAVTPGDYRDMQRVGKQTWLANQTQKLAGSIGDYTGLTGSASAKAAADWLWDVGAPTQFKENRNPVFQRLWMMLRGHEKVGENLVARIMRGTPTATGSPGAAILKGSVDYGPGLDGFASVEKLISDMPDADFQLAARAWQTQTPAESLSKLATDGLVSEGTARAVEQLQEINENFLNKYFLPALDATDQAGKFDALKGYVGPRVYNGDWFVHVKNEQGRDVFLANGKNGAAAQAQAKAVVDEAAARGRVLKADAAVMHGAEYDKDVLQAVSNRVAELAGRDSDVNDIVTTAMRKMAAARGSNTPKVGTPGSFTKRTGLRGAPDVQEFNKKDVISSIRQHYDQLTRFAGYHTFQQRWGQVAEDLKHQAPMMYEDLNRKARYYAGIRGEITQVQDKALRPILGPVLGSRPATKIANATNKLMYAWNIGIANPTFALVNVLQPLQSVSPLLSFATSAPSEAVAKMFQFMPRFDQEGKVAGKLGFLHPMKVMGEAVRMARNAAPDEAEALNRALAEGSLNSQLYEEWVGAHSHAASSLSATYKERGAWPFIQEASTYLAQKSESFSRLIAFNSFYLLGRDHFGLDGDQLFRFADRGTKLSMYSYGVNDKARMMTGPIGSMFGLFKNWQFHFIGQMGQFAGLAVKDGVWGPMLWQGGSALALGGLGATPLGLVADGLARWNSDKPNSYSWMRDNWQGAADEIYFGLPALLGISLQSSVTMPGTDPVNDVTNLTNFTFLEKAKQLGKAIGGAFQVGSAANENALRDPQVRDQLLAALAPRAIFKAFSQVEGDAITSQVTGSPIKQNVSQATAIATRLGFNTVEVESQQQAAQALYQDQQAQRSAIQGLGTAFAHAEDVGDRDEMTRLMGRAVALNLPLSSVMSSARTRIKREQQDSLSKYKASEVERYLGQR